jgi:hypothetical protein
MKGTWRTAYEWAKLLLSLDTNDPYAIGLLIDHLALRGREYKHFIDLSTLTVFSKRWEPFPNIQCSLVLAYFRLNDLQKTRDQLSLAMARYPWIFCKLAQELDIQPIPRRIWGRMPPTQSHELLGGLYIARAQDLWNAPEVTSLIIEVADSLPEEEPHVDSPEIALDLARHVILSDIPSVIAHLPQNFTSGRISASDPLPPYISEAFHQQSDPVTAPISRMREIGGQQWLRDQLDRFRNRNLDIGILDFAHDGDEELLEEGQDPDSFSEFSDQGEYQPHDGDQRSLKESLLGDRLQALQNFFCQYGVDRGNWELQSNDILMDYVRDLCSIEPEQARLTMLYGPIEQAIGPMATSLLEAEMEEFL